MCLYDIIMHGTQLHSLTSIDDIAPPSMLAAVSPVLDERVIPRVGDARCLPDDPLRMR